MHYIHLQQVYKYVIFMMEVLNVIKYKKDVLQLLKNKGYSTYRLRKDKLLGEATMQKLRNLELISWDNMNTICRLLNCQPGDIVEYVEEK